MEYIPELGCYVPVKDDSMETTVKGIFVARDVVSIEEASVAMVEGEIARLTAAKMLGHGERAL